jgi:hypothetical protein
MRLGCSGCLTVLLLLALCAGGAWAIRLALATPDTGAVTATRADGLSAQQKLYDILSRSGRTRQRGRQVVLTERELTAFLSRHLPSASGVPLATVTIRLPVSKVAVVAGQLPLRMLAGETPLADLVAWLPPPWRERPFWLTVHVRPTIEPAGTGKYLRLVPERVEVGRLRVPAIVLRLLLDPRAVSLLAWRVPDHVQDVIVEPGRVLVSAGPSP